MARNSKKAYNKPDEFATDEEKKTYTYGLAYARYIEHQELLSETYRVNRENWRENEAWMNGTQSTENIQKIMINGDKSFAKYDFTPLPIIPKFANSIEENLSLDLFKPMVSAVDPLSQKERDAERRKIQNNRYNEKTRQDFSKLMNVEMEPNGFSPESDDEEELYMGTEYKQDQEVAMEQAIGVVLKANKYKAVRSEAVADVLKTGRCVVKSGYDPVMGVSVDYVDSQRYVNSADSSKLKNKKDSFYHGEIKIISYVELVQKHGVLKSQCISHHNSLTVSSRNVRLEKWDDIASSMVEIMYFEFKTIFSPLYRIKEGRSGGFTIKHKESTFISEHDNISTVSGEDIVWMEGAYVLGSDILIEYEQRAWQSSTALKDKLSSYHVHDTHQMPMIRRMIPSAEKAHMALIKMDQMIAEARPKGIAVNESAMLDIVEKEGGEPLSFLDLIDMYKGDGNMIYRQDQFAGSGIPVTELENGLPRDTMTFLNIYNARLNDLSVMTGVNPMATGASPEQRVSTESNKLALSGSVASIAFIKNAIVGEDTGIESSLYEDIVLRVINIDKYDSKLFKQYVQSVGANNMEELMKLNDFKPYQFVSTIESEPDIAQQEELVADTQIALERGEITLADKIELSAIKSPKLALILLKTRIKQNIKKKQDHEKAMADQNNQAIAAQKQADAKAAIAEIEAKKQLIIDEVDAKHKAKMAEIKLQGDIDKEISGAKKQEDKEKEFRQGQSKRFLQNEMEDSKNKRQVQQQEYQESSKATQ